VTRWRHVDIIHITSPTGLSRTQCNSLTTYRRLVTWRKRWAATYQSGIDRQSELTENDGHENDGPSKLHDMKLQDKNTVLTRITLQWSVQFCCSCYFLNTQHSNTLCVIDHLFLQEAQLPQRDSASATRLSRLAHWSCTSLNTASVVKLYNRLAKLVSTLSANKPCDICTLSWIGHSMSFQVILVGAGRNTERSVVVMCN